MSGTLKNLAFGAVIGAGGATGVVVNMPHAPIVGESVIMDFQPIRLPKFPVVPGDSIIFTVKKIGSSDTIMAVYIGIRDSADLEAKITPKRK